MAFKAYLVSKFTNSHENRMFGYLYESLEKSLRSSDEAHYLIGNFTIDNMEFDALFLKRDAITVIEMKDYDGRIHFSENGDWTADKVVVQGGTWGNPFRQVRAYKFKLLDHLKRNRTEIYDRSRGDMTFKPNQISGVVLFGGSIKFDETLPKEIRSWFAICDLGAVAPRLLSICAPGLKLERAEIDRVLRMLELGTRQLYCGDSDRTEPKPSEHVTPKKPAGRGVRTAAPKKTAEKSIPRGARSEQNRSAPRPARPKLGNLRTPGESDVKSWFRPAERRLLADYFKVIASQSDDLAEQVPQDWMQPHHLRTIQTAALARLDSTLGKVVAARIIQTLRDKGVIL